MPLVFNPDSFTLGIAVGVLGLVLLLSMVVSVAYRELTLGFLAGYLSLMVLCLVLGQRERLGSSVQLLLLVSGPAVMSGFQMWLFRRRDYTLIDKALGVALFGASLGFIGYLMWGIDRPPAAGPTGWIVPATSVWAALMGASLVYRSVQALDTAGPWKWWLMFGHTAGLLVAVLFLADIVDARQAYWPVVLMLLAQVPPIYLSLVWRSRVLNEARLRMGAADTLDPLTGLATPTVLVEQLMRIRASNAQSKTGKTGPTSNVLYLIEVQNWGVLLAERGADFNEQLLLEAAMRLRRSVGDNDLVARATGGRFAVVAQGLATRGDITALATKLVVSGLRVDSPMLQGVELKFRVMVLNLKMSTPLSLPAAQAWLSGLANRFQAWPASHRSRSIWLIDEADDLRERFDAESIY